MLKRLLNYIAKQIVMRVCLPEPAKNETEILAIGKILCNQQKLISSTDLHDYEFKIFSQWGEDGIIQYLINNIKIENNFFIEFGVENYMESNTRFLMMNNNWSGLVIDGSQDNIDYLRNMDWFWKYDLETKVAFIDKSNINELLTNVKYSNIGILSIDIDGNDYHILEQIDFSYLNPSILILEYNSLFGKNRKITIPYNKDFIRTKAHFSNLYQGASLAALTDLAKKKGYVLVGSCSAGVNAFFIREDLQTEHIHEQSIDDVYIESKFRESRNPDGSLSLLSGNDRLSIIQDLEVLNIENGKIEHL